MPFINIFIENSCNISVKDNKLVLKNEEKKAEYPIEDISCIMIDCLYNEISVYALQMLCENGATIIISDEKHLPSSVILPFNKYYKKLSVLNKQIELGKVRQKNLWQKIIKQKIAGQADCLKFNEKEGYKFLTKLAREVTCGDSENAEAKAAIVYFKNLFGNDFTREEDCLINTCLNYTYSIVRSLICRHLCARGFECSIGIFHKNQFNNFNLADDIIEPFRPIIDCFVVGCLTSKTEWSPILKKELFAVVNINVNSGGQIHSLSNAVERVIESLLAYYNKETDNLIMPKLCNLEMHKYE